MGRIRPRHFLYFSGGAVDVVVVNCWNNRQMGRIRPHHLFCFSDGAVDVVVVSFLPSIESTYHPSGRRKHYHMVRIRLSERNDLLHFSVDVLDFAVFGF